MAHGSQPAPAMHGLMAEFDSARTLLDAARRTREAGYQQTDAYSPFPIHGLAEALGFKDRRISGLVLAGGIAGALAGYGLQYWTSVVAYPLNIGGRPFHAWVNFIPSAFELTILFAAFTAGISMIALNGLPQPYHPVFNVPGFDRASQDKFFLAIEATDRQFDARTTRDFLSSLNPTAISEIEP